MPCFRIRMVNSEFESTEEGDYPSLEAARRAAVGTATKVAVESIAAGETSVAVEVEIAADGKMLTRQVITLSIADLTAADERAASDS